MRQSPLQLNSYPSGSGTTATGDGTYALDIPLNAGIALFNNNTGGGSFSLVNRFDAVGSTSPDERPLQGRCRLSPKGRDDAASEPQLLVHTR